MNRNLLWELSAYAFAVAVLVFLIWLAWPSNAQSTAARPAPVVIEGHVVASSVERVEPRTEVMDGTTYEAPPMGDPCAERLAYAQQQIEARDEQVATLQRLLLECEYPPHTPYGNFVRLPESQGLEPAVAARFKDLLSPASFPVLLLPGEVEWLAARYAMKDWKRYADTSERAIVDFLGEARIRREVGAYPERLAELREEYEEEGLFQ